MLTARITPRMIGIGLAIHLGLWLVVTLLGQAGVISQAHLKSWVIRTIAAWIAFGVAVLLNLEIAAEYRKARWLHLAWVALAMNAGLSILRMTAESPVLTWLWPAYTPQMRGLWQHIAIVPANLVLLIGVIAMCLAYHRVGLGFEIERRDYVLMAVIAATLIGLMTFREGLTEAQSPYLVSRYLQLSGLVLLALVSAVSVVLQRMATQMGGGTLALALRVLTLYALARSVLVLLGAIRLSLLPGAEQITGHFLTMAWQAVMWLPALAATYRIQLTVDAARQIEQLERRQAASPAAVVLQG